MASYAYDALNRRIAKTVDGTATAYVYDTWAVNDATAHDAVIETRGGSLLRRWLFGPRTDEPLSFESYAGTTAPSSGSVIELFANRLGSIITAISISTGAVAAEYDFDSFGIRTQTGTLEQPYGFTGREHDAESGLMHYRARTYDPATGTFLQRDPIGFASGDANLYAYVGNNPQSFTDPTGLSQAPTAGGRPGTGLAELGIITNAMVKAGVSATAKVYGGLANGPVMTILRSLLMVQVRAEERAAPPAKAEECHHSKPKYLGGAANQKLTPMLRDAHKELHREMWQFLRQFVKEVHGKMRSMDYGPGWSGVLIREYFPAE